MKTSGIWLPIIDGSFLNKCVMGTKSGWKSVLSVLLSIRQFVWMVSLDLKDAYLQVLGRPEGRCFLRFVSSEGIYQFKVLFFWTDNIPSDLLPGDGSWLHGSSHF